jgi:hypothetical protein
MAVSTFPLVLAGPVLRDVGHDSVTVFVALRESRQVTLRVFTGTGGSRTPVCEGAGQTVALGTALHVVAVTARTSSPVARLVPERTYYYDLDFGPGQNTLGAAGVLEAAAVVNPLAYAGADLPTFAYPPSDLSQVRLVHGSCRKAHGPSPDALPGVDEMISQAGSDSSTPAFARDRPHQLLLTGDQIYADDVADALLYLLVDATDTLLGWTETLPGAPAAAALAPGARGPLTLASGLTSGIPDAAIPKSHLIRFGEFCAMYVFAWSPTLWPAAADLPPATTVYGGSAAPATFGTEMARLTQFRESIVTVRKVLANVPTYMVLDDHEVTDDWFMNRRWCAAANKNAKPPGGALASAMGRRIMQNALASYAVFQAWGSTPGRFGSGALGQLGRELLAALGRWRGADDDARELIELRVGVPPVLPATSTVLAKPVGSLRWSYRIAPLGTAYEILVLDCRTEREYPPAANGDLLPPGLLSGDAARVQIIDQPEDGRALTLMVAQTPVLGLPGIERSQESSTGTDIWKNDPEAWSLNKTAYERVLAALALRRERVVVLAGDVHYSFVARMSLRLVRPFGVAPLSAPRSAVIAQLTSSSFRNEGDTFISSLRLHEGGYNQLGVNFKGMGDPVHRVGWNDASRAVQRRNPSDPILIPVFQKRSWDHSPVVADPDRQPPDRTFVNPPEWEYRITYLPGRKPTRATANFPRLEVIPQDPWEAAVAAAELHTAYETSLDDDWGRDIVGRNNVSELRFTVDSSGVPTEVRQLTWWRLGADASIVPTTTFTVPLAPGSMP